MINVRQHGFLTFSKIQQKLGLHSFQNQQINPEAELDCGISLKASIPFAKRFQSYL